MTGGVKADVGRSRVARLLGLDDLVLSTIHARRESTDLTAILLSRDVVLCTAAIGLSLKEVNLMHGTGSVCIPRSFVLPRASSGGNFWLQLITFESGPRLMRIEESCFGDG
jgi:hypothetical protein